MPDIARFAPLKPTDLLHGPIAAEAYRGVCELDRLEHAHGFRQRTKFHLVQLTAGIAVVIFPFTPVMVENCRAGEGFLCGARISAFVAAVGAVVIGLQSGWSFWQERGYLAAQAARMSEHLGLRRGSGLAESSPGSIYTAYLSGNQKDRKTMRTILQSQARGI